MFAGASLGARIDRAEGRLMEGMAAATRDAHPGMHPLVRHVSGGIAAYFSPGSPLNKVIGLGFEGPLDVASLAAVEREWCARGEAVRVELSILAEPTVGPALAARGYQLHGFENVSGRPLGREEPAPPALGITTEVLRREDQDLWLDLAVTGFMSLDGTGSGPDDSMPREELERVLSEIAVPSSFTRYLARVDGQPAGVASLAIEGGLAQIAGATTLPAFRGRGVQKALLHRRLADAVALGCDLAVVTTAPGTRSQENVMKRGFILLYTRAVLVKHWEDSY